MGSFQLERLESLLRSALSGSEPDLHSALEKINNELAVRLSQSSPDSFDFFVRTLRALKKVRGTGNSALRLASLRHCISFFMHHANFGHAFEAASLQYGLARKIESPDACRRALNSMGTAQAELGNVPAALAHYSRALELARDMGDLEIEGVVLNNMGTALNYASLYREAIPCFERVLSISQSTWKLPVRKKALTNLSQSLYYLERFDVALEAIQEALRGNVVLKSGPEHFDQALREFTLVQIALELDRATLAVEHASLCAKHAIMAKSISRQLMANIASARCDVRIGDVQKGLRRLEELVTDSIKIDSMYKDALIAAIQANDEAGRPEVALLHMERLLRYVRERRMAAVGGLLAIPGYQRVSAVSSSLQVDLLNLEYKHASLRARAAERKSVKYRCEMLERLAITADLKVDISGEHGYRVGRLASMLAVRIGWSAERAFTLEVAARLHDIGKIAIPDKILGTSESLRDAERQLMCKHVEIGAELLAGSDVAELNLAATVAKYHHEWWDGNGYPERLSGSHIPIHARLVALADAFDSMTHGRAFGQACQPQQAVEEIMRRRTTQFDPRLTDEFVAMVHDLSKHHNDLDAFLASAANDSPFLQVRKRIRSLLNEGQVDLVEEAPPS